MEYKDLSEYFKPKSEVLEYSFILRLNKKSIYKNTKGQYCVFDKGVKFYTGTFEGALNFILQGKRYKPSSSQYKTVQKYCKQRNYKQIDIS